MAPQFDRPLRDLLRAAGCALVRQGKGSHEKSANLIGHLVKLDWAFSNATVMLNRNSEVPKCQNPGTEYLSLLALLLGLCALDAAGAKGWGELSNRYLFWY